MKKLVGILAIILGTFSFAASGIGIVSDEDFIAVGVSKENLAKVKKIIEEAGTQYKLKTLDKRSLEIEVNKCMLEGTAKNLDKLNVLVDKICVIDANIIKDRLKYQVEVQKYITTDQYVKAREKSLERLSLQQKNLKK